LYPATFLWISSFTIVEILSDEKSSNTRRIGELRFYFTPMVPDEFRLIIWGPEQRIHRILKAQCRTSSYKECVVG
jgi:hypothetical protein